MTKKKTTKTTVKKKAAPKKRKKIAGLTTSLLDEMVEKAVAVRGNAYAPYSKYQVGAAILSESGTIYVGANCENAHYKATHAESSAIAAMVSAGARVIRAVVVAGPDDRPLSSPCGSCRQEINEFATANTPIYCVGDGGAHGRIYSLESLLPESFGPKSLTKLKKIPQKRRATKKKVKK